MLVQLGQGQISGNGHLVGVGLDVVPACPERCPRRHRCPRPASPTPSCRCRGVIRDVDQVAGSSGNRVPLHDRNVRLIAGGTGIHVRAGVAQVVAHVQVLDARWVDRGHLVEGLDEVGPAVPDTGITGRVERADAPVIRVVAEDDRRRKLESRWSAQVQRALGPGAKSTEEVHLDLVFPWLRTGGPGELRVEHLVGSHQVGDRRGRRRGARTRTEGGSQGRAFPLLPSESTGSRSRSTCRRKEVEGRDVVRRPRLLGAPLLMTTFARAGSLASVRK